MSDDNDDKKNSYLFMDEIVATYGNGKNYDEEILDKLEDCIDRLTPDYIYSKLDEKVMGQEYAKRCVSTAAYNIFLRFKNYMLNGYHSTIDKSNLLFIGESGMGKTFLIKTLAEVLNWPVGILDVTRCTSSGYVGDSVQVVLPQVIKSAYDKTQGLDLLSNYSKLCYLKLFSEFGIVYIDEVDKIRVKNEGSKRNRDIAGQSVQEELLKMLEGTEIQLDRDYKCALPEIDTTNMLFIVGGRFEGIEDIIQERLTKNKASMGFGGVLKKSQTLTRDEITKYINNDDLQEFGMMKEFLGRVHHHVAFHTLTDAHLRDILTKGPSSVIGQYRQLFAMHGVEVDFSKAVIDYYVSKAKDMTTGARGLRSIVEKSIQSIQFHLPQEKIQSYFIDLEDLDT